uniref:DUF2313 domain-containing protein n=1 Tax=Steinernema glaseri TaxID=37863 RepID=A0A1I7YEZ0_9BILA
MKTYNNLDSLLQDSTDDSKKLRQFAIVEEPIQRFAKAYTDMCYNNSEWSNTPAQEICDQCLDSIPCFVQRYYRRLQVIAEGEVEPESFDLPLIPQNWFCNFHDNIEKYQILQVPAYSKGRKRIASNLEKFFSVSGVTKDDAKVIGGAFGQLKVAAKEDTEGSDKYTDVLEEIKADPILGRMLLKMYYFDFEYFNYAYPMISKSKQAE